MDWPLQIRKLKNIYVRIKFFMKRYKMFGYISLGVH